MRPQGLRGLRPWVLLLLRPRGSCFHLRVRWSCGGGGSVDSDRAASCSCVCAPPAPERPLNERRRVHEFAELGKTERLGNFGRHLIDHIERFLLGEEIQFARVFKAAFTAFGRQAPL